MNPRQFARFTTKWLAAGIGFAAASYATYVGITFLRYGKTKPAEGADTDVLLDTLMPNYEVVDRHKARIAAPPDVALSVAAELNLRSCPAVRGIFKGRELIMRSRPDNTVRPRGLLLEMKSLGWRVLAEVPGREIVAGAVTKPWEPNPVFRGLAPEQFTQFHEPGFVKIIRTLRADPDGNGETVFRTETRATATDFEARKKFRRYWAFLSPGIVAIRTVMLPAIKAESERRWRRVAA
jgi:hypothetical protein